MRAIEWTGQAFGSATAKAARRSDGRRRRPRTAWVRALEALEGRALLATIQFPTNLSGSPGEVVEIPLNIDNSDGIESVDLAISYDTTRLQLNSNADVKRGTISADFDSFLASVDDAAGQIGVTMTRNTPTSGKGAGSLILIDFTIRPDAPPGDAIVNLLESVARPPSPDLVTNINGNPPNPPASNAAGDSLDGIITVLATGATVTPTTLTTTEAAGANHTATFNVVLNTAPTGDVTIPITSGNPAEGTVDQTSLTFTPANWNVPQTVTVTGVDDNVADGDVSYNVLVGPATSADPGYQGFDPTDVAVINLNDDVVGVTVNPLDVTTTEAAGAGHTATFTVVLTSQPTADVTIPVTSGNLAEGTVDQGSLTFTPANWNVAQTVTVTGVDDPNIDGAQTYTVSVGPATSGDPKYSGLDPADVTVTNLDDEVNDPPSFTVGADVTVSEDSGSQVVAGFLTNISPGPPNESDQTVTFLVNVDNPTLFSAPPTINASGDLSFTPAPDAFGAATVTVVAMDSGGTANGGQDTSAPQTFTITIAAVNDAPSFTAGTNQTIDEDAPAQTVPNFATNISAGPANEADQQLTFLIGVDNPGLFSAPPSISPDGTLTYTPAPDANGLATVIVTLTDNGGTAGGGQDTSASQSFTITINAVNDPPTLDPLADVTIDEDAPAQTVDLAGISPGPADEEGQSVTVFATSSNPTLIANPMVAYNGGTTGSVAFTPTANANGTATITVTVTDSQGGVTERAFLVTVAAVNDPPTVAAPIADQNVVEDAAATVINLLPVFADADLPNDVLAYSVVNNTNTGLVTATIQGSSLRLAYAPNASGTAQITLRATDQAGESAETTFQVAVGAINDAPTVVSPIADVRVTKGASPVTIALGNTFADVDLLDGEVLDLALAGNSNPNLVTASLQGTTLTLAFAPGATGTANLRVRATDEEGASATTSFTVTVAEPATRPVVTVAPLSATAGVPLAGATVATFTDVNADQAAGDFTATVDFGDGTAPVSGTVVKENGTFRVVADHTFATVGTFPVIVTVTDAAAGTVEARGTATVTAPPISLGIGLDAGSDTGTSSSDRITGDASPTFTGTAAPGTAVRVLAQPSGGGQEIVLGTASAGSDGTFAITSPVLSDGTYTVRAEATNAAGGVVQTTTLGSVVIDTTPPRLAGVRLDPISGRFIVTFADPGAGIAPDRALDPSSYLVSSPAYGFRGVSVTSVQRVSDNQYAVILNGGRPIFHGRFFLTISAPGVSDLAGNNLDGEFGGRLPSGNGLAGGNFNAHFGAAGWRTYGPRPVSFGASRFARPFFGFRSFVPAFNSGFSSFALRRARSF